jgi:putative transcriptional regulator
VGRFSELSLAPGLLLSMPHLLDPNFTRAVVLMIEHNDDGSFGLVINQPSEMSVGSLLEVLDIEWEGDSEALVWTGGPVMPTSGWVLHHPIEALGRGAPDLQTGLEHGGTIDVAPGLSLSTSPARLRLLAADPPQRTRFLLGYAGWGPGQLAEEMTRGSWLHADIDADIVFDAPAEEMWEIALRSIGVDPEAIVQGRGVH